MKQALVDKGLEDENQGGPSKANKCKQARGEHRSAAAVLNLKRRKSRGCAEDDRANAGENEADDGPNDEDEADSQCAC